MSVSCPVVHAASAPRHLAPAIAPVLLVLSIVSCAAQPTEYEQRIQEWSAAAPALALPPEGGQRPPPVALPGPNEPVEAWVDWAEAHNPGLRAAHERWSAALLSVEFERGWPDPRLRLGYMLDHVETRTGPIRGQIGISQPLPWFGTLDAAGQRAFERAEEAREDYEAARLLVGERVRASMHELAWLESAVAVADGHRALVAQWEQVARSRYASGSASHADVLRAQVELGKLEERALALADLREPFAARLNAALGRPPGLPVEPPADPYPTRIVLDESALQAALATTSPVLRARARRVTAADSAITLADAAFYPDFSIGLDYTSIGSARSSGVSGSGDDALAVTLGMDLPVWRDRYAAGLSRARAERSAAVAAEAEAHNRLGAELAMTVYELRDADRRLSLYRDGLVPKGRQALAAISAAYSAGEASLFELVDAQRELIEFELSSARAETDRANAVVHVGVLTGLTLYEEEGP